MNNDDRLSWISRLKPSLNKNWLYLIAGAMWSGVGIWLCLLAYRWLKPVSINYTLIFAAVGLLLAGAIYLFGFRIFANRNILRINAYAQDRVCIFAFQQWTSYPLVVVMVSLGVFLRVYAPIPKPYLTVLYIGIGGSLFLASFLYYRKLARISKEV